MNPHRLVGMTSLDRTDRTTHTRRAHNRHSVSGLARPNYRPIWVTGSVQSNMLPVATCHLVARDTYRSSRSIAKLRLAPAAYGFTLASGVASGYPHAGSPPLHSQ